MRLPLLVVPWLVACAGPRDTSETGDTDDTEVVEDVTLRVIGFNVESGDSDPTTIAAQIDGIKGETLWGFNEVQSYAWAETFAAAAGAEEPETDFQIVYGSTGWEDRLVIVWDQARLQLVDHWEIASINVGGTARAPLVAELEVRETGTRLLFMVNHLWRTETSSRHTQADLLHDWALDQDLPVVTVGDFNFDWDVENGEAWHDEGYDLMTADDAWVWVRPEELIRTQCSGDSVLDFVFVAGDAREWPAEGEVLFPDPAYCHDTALTSDHRPVSARITIPG